VIHPATGELEESEEDYSGSGPRKGGLVPLMRNENTPVTELHLKPLESLPVGTKSRLKVEIPSGAGDVKIYEDYQKTKLVVSEQTEFFARVDRKFFLEGVDVSESSSITVTQQIKLGDDWVEGDSVSLTVVHSEIPVVMRAFIPHAWTEGEEPIPVAVDYITNPNDPNPIPVPQLILSNCVGGNRQEFSEDSYDDEEEYKLRQEVVITPYEELHGSVDVENERRRGITLSSKFCKKSEDVPASDQNAAFGETFVPGATANWEFQPPEPSSKYEDVQRVENSAGNKVSQITSSLSGEVGSPNFVPSATIPNIDFKFKIKAERVEEHGVSKVYFTTDAKHNLYPAYELNVENSDEEYSPVYRYSPKDHILPGPVSLNMSHEGGGHRVEVK
jgi:hypothetical protein